MDEFWLQWFGFREKREIFFIGCLKIEDISIKHFLWVMQKGCEIHFKTVAYLLLFFYFFDWLCGMKFELWTMASYFLQICTSKLCNPFPKQYKLKWLHPIIFVSNIFPNSHLIQKCIHNQQLFLNNIFKILGHLKVLVNICL